MRLGMIWAQDPCGVLGASGTMLWRVPADFRHFKAVTLGGAVIMGRTTWESIGGALTGRAHIVLRASATVWRWAPARSPAGRWTIRVKAPTALCRACG